MFPNLAGQEPAKVTRGDNKKPDDQPNIPKESPAGVKTRSTADLSKYRIDNLPPYKSSKSKANNSKKNTGVNPAHMMNKNPSEGGGPQQKKASKVVSSAQSKKQVRFSIPDEKSCSMQGNNDPRVTPDSKSISSEYHAQV